MLNSVRAVARFFQNTIGWNRIGVMLSVAIITVAVVVLVRMLHDIDVDEVYAALKATQFRYIAAAAVFVAIWWILIVRIHRDRHRGVKIPAEEPA